MAISLKLTNNPAGSYSPTTITPARPADHHNATRYKATVHHVVQGHPTEGELYTHTQSL